MVMSPPDLEVVATLPKAKPEPPPPLATLLPPTESLAKFTLASPVEPSPTVLPPQSGVSLPQVKAIRGITLSKRGRRRSLNPSSKPYFPRVTPSSTSSTAVLTPTTAVPTFLGPQTTSTSTSPTGNLPAVSPFTRDLYALLGIQPSPVIGLDTLNSFSGNNSPLPLPTSQTSLPTVTDLLFDNGGSSTSMSRIRSDPGSSSAGGRSRVSNVGPVFALQQQKGGMEPGKIAQFGNDLAWKTILASEVEVEGIGQVPVSRILLEVWRKGGGEHVSGLGQWPIIIQSLSTSAFSPSNHLPTPHACSALQSLYSVSLRHWEPSIFSGLAAIYGGDGSGLNGNMSLLAMLEAFISQSQSNIVSPISNSNSDPSPEPSSAGQYKQVFGISTPTKELDLSQWTTLTPDSSWDTFNPTFNTLPGPSGLKQDISDDLTNLSDGFQDLDDILAQLAQHQDPTDIIGSGNLAGYLPSAAEIVDHRKNIMINPFSVLTPETSANSGSNSDNSPNIATQLSPPSSNDSPFPTLIPGTNISSLPLPNTVSTKTTSIESVIKPTTKPEVIERGGNRQLATPACSSNNIPKVSGQFNKNRTMSLILPTSNFVPPPPMCMFFSPNFHDLQNGKVGVWKGPLEVKGKGGGKFEILIIGEASTGHLWQSHTWPQTISYPQEGGHEQAMATASMIPVSHLAREGFTPAAMGMVLCNDSNLQAYVEMVQGFHAEGVAFHLGTSQKLPIVFLPSKFDSKDPLQRLGIAFMTKPGSVVQSQIPLRQPSVVPPQHKKATTASNTPIIPSKKLADIGEDEDEGTRKKKKRRQSAPASQMIPPQINGKHKKKDSMMVERKGTAAEVLAE